MIRIIGGELSGRRIDAPEGRTTRPMSDRVRGALFNILENRRWDGLPDGFSLAGARVLDMFGGTGALSFEALSRGAVHAALFDLDDAALKTARGNASKLGVEGRCDIIRADATHPPRNDTALRDLVFVAPPYRKGLVHPAIAAAEKAGWLSPSALIAIEVSRKEEPDVPDWLKIELSRTHGDTTLHFGVKGP